MKNVKMYHDAQGNEIPSNYIHKTDREKDAAAIRFEKRARKLSEAMQAYKVELLKECDKLYQKTLEENRITPRENSKGSYTISTVDKSIKVEVTVQDTISFNDNIDLAHQVIKDFLKEKTSGGDPELAQLINHAFETKRGKMDVKRIMGLMKLKIEHPKWLQGIELIKKAIETNTSKRYVRIWVRQPEGNYEAIKLDFAAI